MCDFGSERICPWMLLPVFRPSNCHFSCSFRVLVSHPVPGLSKRGPFCPKAGLVWCRLGGSWSVGFSGQAHVLHSEPCGICCCFCFVTTDAGLDICQLPATWSLCPEKWGAEPFSRSNWPPLPRVCRQSLAHPSSCPKPPEVPGSAPGATVAPKSLNCRTWRPPQDTPLCSPL